MNSTDKQVTGKALMLDEIINYVQSLQNQVEVKLLTDLLFGKVFEACCFIIHAKYFKFLQFLSMKLASLNPMFYDFGMDLDPYIARPEPVHATQCSNTIVYQVVIFQRMFHHCRPYLS